MASVASQLIEEVTAHAQSDSLEEAREICADGFPNNLRICSPCFKPRLFYVLFALTVLANVHNFLIYAPSFWVTDHWLQALY